MLRVADCVARWIWFATLQASTIGRQSRGGHIFPNPGSTSSLEEEAEVVVVSVFLFFVPFQVLK